MFFLLLLLLLLVVMLEVLGEAAMEESVTSGARVPGLVGLWSC